jgi:hypothetical protein
LTLKNKVAAALEPERLQLSYYLHQYVSSYSSLLDLGSGAGEVWGAHIPTTVSRRTAVDLHHPSLEQGLASGVYTHSVQSDALNFLRSQTAQSHDVVLAISVIEHLPHEKGVELAREMRRVAKHLAIIFTPNGFVAQPPTSDNPFQEHVSGWDVTNLRLLGYEFVGGFSGLKFLRTFRGRPRLGTNAFATLCLLLTTRIVHQSERLAFEILVKSEKSDKSNFSRDVVLQ